jgi:hypothetical protein
VQGREELFHCGTGRTGGTSTGFVWALRNEASGKCVGLANRGSIVGHGFRICR